MDHALYANYASSERVSYATVLAGGEREIYERPTRGWGPPYPTNVVDQYGYTIPAGTEPTETDIERSRRIKEYMDQGMSFA